MSTEGHNHKRALSAFPVLPLVMGLALLANSGCAVFMAAKQPEAKDLSVLDKGKPRTHVIAELGTPVWSGEKEGNKVDVFSFTQGYSKGAKVGRAFFHGAADVLTLGLWEVVGTPIESAASGTPMKVEVVYDEHDKVKGVEYIGQEKSEDTQKVEGEPATAKAQDGVR